jgi:hypothetical protein
LVDLSWLQKQGQIGAPVDAVARQRVQGTHDGALAVPETDEPDGGKTVGAEDLTD